MKKLIALALVAILGCLAMGPAQAQSNDPDVIDIGYFNWSDNLFVTNVIQYILEEKMDYKTKMTMAAPALIYQGVASGQFDFQADAWLPKTHADYFKKVALDVIDLGAAYTHAKLGWVVPDYVPKDAIDSIEDLKSEEVMKKLDGKIIGIDPGAGLSRLSKQAMKDYGLSDFGYELVLSSGPGMTAALKRAISNKEWIVVTGWSPHWMFGAWDLRYIADPQGTLGGLERADILARHGFYVDQPEVYEMLDRMTIPLDDVQKGMYEAENSSYDEAAKAYVDGHPDLVHYWITGEIGGDS